MLARISSIPTFVELVGRDQMGSVGSRGLDLLYPSTARRPKPNLEDFTDMRHLGGSADRARVALTHAVHVVSPVNVLIDLNERDWALLVQSAKHRNRDSVVAADDDRKRACGKNLRTAASARR